MEMPDSIELLTTALKDRVPGVRVEAVRALGETKNPRALEPLEYALTDPEPDVRAEVADALQLLKTGRGKVASSPFRSVPRPLRPRLEDLPPASTGTWPAAACGFLLKLQGVFGMCYWGVWMIPGCIVYKPHRRQLNSGPFSGFLGCGRRISTVSALCRTVSCAVVRFVSPPRWRTAPLRRTESPSDWAARGFDED